MLNSYLFHSFYSPLFENMDIFFYALEHEKVCKYISRNEPDEQAHGRYNPFCQPYLKHLS